MLKKLAIATSLLYPITGIAAQQKDTCNWDGDIPVCSTTFTPDNKNQGISYSYEYHHRNGEAYINNLEYETRINGVTKLQLEEALSKSLSKRVWTQEEVIDFTHNLKQIQLLIKHILLKTPDLSEGMEQSLNKALAKSSSILSLISTVPQVSNHLINKEWGYAASELSTFVIGLGISYGVGAAAAYLSVPVVIGAGIGIGIGYWFNDDIEDYIDNLLQGANQSELDKVLRNTGKSFNINVYKVIEDSHKNLYCSFLPHWKRIKDPNCFVPPIVLDLDDNGIDFIQLDKSKALFDVNNDGVMDSVSWPSKGNGTLFIDWNRNGIVDNRNEFMLSLFVNEKDATDLDGLKLFDYNEDGMIDPSDKVYDHLFIWDDKNQDGNSSSDEIISSRDLNLRISLDSKGTNLNKDGNWIDEKFNIFIGNKTLDGYSVRLKAKLN